MKRTTIKDIANYLTISVSTVSRALTNDKNIRSETRDRVIAAAEALGYRPNPVATNLKYGRSGTVGVLVPEMITPFASQIIGGIQHALHSCGIKIIIADSHESWQIERENIATMEKFMVDGIIVCLSDYKENRDEYLRLQRAGMPMVFFDRIPHGMEVSQVIVDDYYKSFFLIEHLIRAGRKHIAHIHGPASVYNSLERYKGYRDALHKFNIELSQDLIIKSGLGFDDGALAAEELMNRGVKIDAIFAFTDTLAIGAMNKLREMGVAMPDDIAITSFSGTQLSKLVTPQLTTIEPPLHQMGIEAANLILERIEDPHSPVRSIVLDATMQFRASSEG